ncbi:MAG: hypothetical protein PVI40_05270 [Chlamydiota bacterium]
MRFILWVKKELLRFVPVFLFFLVFFLLINSAEVHLYKRAGITPFSFIEIAIAAALIAKIMLVIDHFFFIEFFQKHPLVYGIAWKTFIYLISLMLVRLTIRFIPFLLKGNDPLDIEYEKYLQTINWNFFIAIQIYYLMLLFIFVTFRELTVKIGVKKMKKLFFQKNGLR